jgi:ribosomal protein S18 acetylase RimI-like enzyme
VTQHVLDNAGWAALNGPHAEFAEVNGQAARYPADVSPFAALADTTDPAAWRDLAALAGPGAQVFVPGRTVQPPPGWDRVFAVDGVQLTGETVAGAHDPEAVRLGAADVPEMLDLVERTDPGPFRKRTVELGTYLGVRRDGRLVAMAGERLHVPGWVEISAVCTDPDHRGGGLAARLIRAVTAGIRDRGEQPFLHTGAANTIAIRLYERLGFTARIPVLFGMYRVPAPPTAP